MAQALKQDVGGVLGVAWAERKQIQPFTGLFVSWGVHKKGQKLGTGGMVLPQYGGQLGCGHAPQRVKFGDAVLAVFFLLQPTAK